MCHHNSILFPLFFGLFVLRTFPGGYTGKGIATVCGSTSPNAETDSRIFERVVLVICRAASQADPTNRSSFGGIIQVTNRDKGTLLRASIAGTVSRRIRAAAVTYRCILGISHRTVQRQETTGTPWVRSAFLGGGESERPSCHRFRAKLALEKRKEQEFLRQWGMNREPT
jgi:hypothetical protein